MPEVKKKVKKKPAEPQTKAEKLPPNFKLSTRPYICPACLGTGVNSKGGECFPCLGTGRHGERNKQGR